MVRGFGGGKNVGVGVKKYVGAEKNVGVEGGANKTFWVKERWAGAGLGQVLGLS